MIVIVLAVLGGIWGALIARKRKGNSRDMAQYAAGFAILFAIVGLFLTILAERMIF